MFIIQRQCPLCHKILIDNPSIWKQHLISEKGCLMNPRRVRALKRRMEESQGLNVYRSWYLNPLDSPSSTMEMAIAQLNNYKAHWEEHIGALDNVRRLTVHHQGTLKPKLNVVTSLVIRHCQNIRSKVFIFPYGKFLGYI